jgi:putative endopeptidase
MPHKHWGFDIKTIDRAVSPKTDFYRYANGNWMRTNVVPPAESRWGSFNILRKVTEHQTLAIMEGLLKKRAPKGTDAQLVADLYRSGMDMKRRNKLGAAPLAPYRKLIDTMKPGNMEKVLAKLSIEALTAPWALAVDQDSKKSETYILHLGQSGLGLPDRDYYLKDDAEFLRVRTAYLAFIKKLFVLSGSSPRESAHAVETVMRIETALAKASMDKVDMRDPDKRYHKMTVPKLARIAPGFNWHQFFKSLGVPPIKELIVEQPEFMTSAAQLLKTLPLADVQTYLTWQLLLSSAGSLSEPFIKANFAFYGKVVSGQKVMRPLWRRVLQSVNGMVGFAFGRLYVEKHFGEAAKRTMDQLVSDLFVVYERRMQTLDWMSPQTKKKAVEKLRAVSRKIGYPTKWRTYTGLDIRADDYFGNGVRFGIMEHKRAMKKLKKPVDRTEWFMTPQTVNAYCSFNLNEIVFPAAILQHPFFDLSNDAAVNYGAIGSVIGHEMTHAFDDQGSKFDKLGNLKSWWTPEDRKRFDERAQILVRQYNEFMVADGVKVNGELTLGENIADLGGLVIAYDAFQEYLARTGDRRVIDGFTPEQRFFLGFAQQEQEIARPEFQKFAALNDPHSPAEFRVNGPLSHFEPFYMTFGVQPGDPMHREPKDRAHIW